MFVYFMIVVGDGGDNLFDQVNLVVIFLLLLGQNLMVVMIGLEQVIFIVLFDIDKVSGQVWFNSGVYVLSLSLVVSVVVICEMQLQVLGFIKFEVMVILVIDILVIVN